MASPLPVRPSPPSSPPPHDAAAALASPNTNVVNPPPRPHPPTSPPPPEAVALAYESLVEINSKARSARKHRSKARHRPTLRDRLRNRLARGGRDPNNAFVAGTKTKAVPQLVRSKSGTSIAPLGAEKHSAQNAHFIQRSQTERFDVRSEVSSTSSSVYSSDVFSETGSIASARTTSTYRSDYSQKRSRSFFQVFQCIPAFTPPPLPYSQPPLLADYEPPSPSPPLLVTGDRVPERRRESFGESQAQGRRRQNPRASGGKWRPPPPPTPPPPSSLRVQTVPDDFWHHDSTSSTSRGNSAASREAAPCRQSSTVSSSSSRPWLGLSHASTSQSRQIPPAFATSDIFSAAPKYRIERRFSAPPVLAMVPPITKKSMKTIRRRGSVGSVAFDTPKAAASREVLGGDRVQPTVKSPSLFVSWYARLRGNRAPSTPQPVTSNTNSARQERRRGAATAPSSPSNRKTTLWRFDLSAPSLFSRLRRSSPKSTEESTSGRASSLHGKPRMSLAIDISPEAISTELLDDDEDDAVPLSDGESLFDIADDSHLIGRADLEKLISKTPARYHCQQWRRVFNTHDDGVSLQTFLRKSQETPASVMLVQDTEKKVFGVFASVPWKQHNTYYGSGESFVFAFNGGALERHRATLSNNFFLFVDKTMVSVGAGDGAALYIDNQLLNGYSSTCDTFSNPSHLSSTKDFTVQAIEVWGPTAEY